jgi:hypothetical protein
MDKTSIDDSRYVPCNQSDTPMTAGMFHVTNLTAGSGVPALVAGVHRRAEPHVRGAARWGGVQVESSLTHSLKAPGFNP